MGIKQANIIKWSKQKGPDNLIKCIINKPYLYIVDQWNRKISSIPLIIYAWDFFFTISVYMFLSNTYSPILAKLPYHTDKENSEILTLQGSVAQLIETQRQKLGFNMKVKKNKTSSQWILALPQSEMVIHLPGMLRRRLCVRAVSSHFKFLSNAGIKGMYLYHSVSMAI